jgi:hypothetical protein
MGNLSSLIYPKTINKLAFGYCKKSEIDDKNAFVEILTDDFSKVEEIKEKILTNPKLHIINNSAGDSTPTASGIADDVIVALTYYLNNNPPHDKIILSQTDLFLFKNGPSLPVLCIKNTKAVENREKLFTNKNQSPLFFIASCDLSKLYYIR